MIPAAAKPSRTLQRLAARLRGATPPIVARNEDGRLLLDLRSIAPDEDAEVIDALAGTARLHLAFGLLLACGLAR